MYEDVEQRRVRLVSPAPGENDQETREDLDVSPDRGTAQDELDKVRVHSVRTIPQFRRKKGSKKSSGPALSYDELIESKKQMFSYSEFALINQFEEDLDYEP